MKMKSKEIIFKILQFLGEYSSGIAFILITMCFFIWGTIYTPILWAVADTQRLLGFNVTIIFATVLMLWYTSREGLPQINELTDKIVNKLRKKFMRR